jgi:hypothetical protein
MFDDIIISKKEPIHSPIVYDTLPSNTSSSGTNVITEINVENLKGHGGETLSV